MSLSPQHHLDLLESEAVHILRELAAERERPVLLFSGGKDSIVLLRLAEKAFRPARFPFPVMHVDTGHNFPEVIAFRCGRPRVTTDRRFCGMSRGGQFGSRVTRIVPLASERKKGAFASPPESSRSVILR